jgi:hypothetical protein
MIFFYKIPLNPPFPKGEAIEVLFERRIWLKNRGNSGKQDGLDSRFHPSKFYGERANDRGNDKLKQYSAPVTQGVPRLLN